MHKAYVCPGISYIHKSINYIKYDHGVSYITINTITESYTTQQKIKYNSLVVAPT